MNFYPFVREVKYLKTWVMPRLSLYSRIKAIAVNSTIMELTKCWHKLFLPDYRYWQIVYTQNLSVTSDQEDPLLNSVRQLQQKCRKQQQLLYLAFSDVIKAFDLVSRTELFKLLEKIGCPPTHLSVIASFHVHAWHN